MTWCVDIVRLESVGIREHYYLGNVMKRRENECEENKGSEKCWVTTHAEKRRKKSIKIKDKKTYSSFAKSVE